MEEGEMGPLSVRMSESRASFDTAPLLAAALKHHAELADVQTAAVVMIVLQDHRLYYPLVSTIYLPITCLRRSQV